MTNGIEVQDKVRLKGTGDIGRVVGINDWNDRYPADLQVEFEGEETFTLKTRVDLVEKL